MKPAEVLHDRLTAVEAQLDAVATALLTGDSERLKIDTTALRDAAAEVSFVLSSLPQEAFARQPELQARISRIGQRLATYRDNLARRSAAVDRTLASLLPSDDVATYARAPGMGGYGAGRFGSRFS